MTPNKPPKRQYHFAKHTQASKEQEQHEEVTIVVTRSALSRIAVRVNVIRPLCSMMFGKNHSVLSRMAAGVVIATTGVIIAKYFGHSHEPIIAYVGDGVGYGLHGLGLTPFIEYLAEEFE